MGDKKLIELLKPLDALNKLSLSMQSVNFTHNVEVERRPASERVVVPALANLVVVHFPNEARSFVFV